MILILCERLYKRCSVMHDRALKKLEDHCFVLFYFWRCGRRWRDGPWCWRRCFELRKDFRYKHVFSTLFKRIQLKMRYNFAGIHKISGSSRLSRHISSLTTTTHHIIISTMTRHQGCGKWQMALFYWGGPNNSNISHKTTMASSTAASEVAVAAHADQYPQCPILLSLDYNWI